MEYTPNVEYYIAETKCGSTNEPPGRRLVEEALTPISDPCLYFSFLLVIVNVIFHR
jgi:hypothetical protein